MILTYSVKKDEAGVQFAYNRLASVESGGVLAGLSFARRELRVYAFPSEIILLYDLEASFPPFYLAGLLLAGFFMFMGFSFWLWFIPLLFGCSGFFYSKPYNDLMFKLSLFKNKVTGGKISYQAFIRRVCVDGTN